VRQDVAAWTPASAPPGSARICAGLDGAGAVEATSADDLAFFREDRDDDNVDTPGFVADRRVVANRYEPSERPHTGEAHRIYVIQPWDRLESGEGPDPLEAFEDGGEHAAVWFSRTAVPAGRSTSTRASPPRERASQPPGGVSTSARE
jgi:hypothetical protein